MSELIVIQPENALSVFSETGKLDPLLDSIAKEVRAFIPDVSTVSGRKEIASMAYKVAQSKTYLDSIGKNLVDEYKEIPKKIDANRKAVRDFLDNLRDEVRKPLNDYEAEQAAIEKARLEAIEAEQLKQTIERDYELAVLMNVQFDRDKADQLKADIEAKEAHEREIARKAAQAAEDAAQARILSAEREAREANERAIQAVKDAEFKAQKAIEDEAKRIADSLALQNAETSRRLADVAHRGTINREAVESLAKIGISEDVGKSIITAIVTGKIAHVRIEY